MLVTLEPKKDSTLSEEAIYEEIDSLTFYSRHPDQSIPENYS